MKNIKLIRLNKMLILGLVLILVYACERDVSDDAIPAGFSTDGDVFTDNFSEGLDYFPFVDAGADAEAFSVVTDDVFSGNAAMRFDVPSFGNGFVGATFNTTVSRNLTGYDALTFYAKASQAATIDAIGFGIDGETNNKFQVELSGLEVSTNWKKYVIPIPDPSKLESEKGLFWLAEGASSPGGEGGYILWFDEIKFERLGTVAQPQPRIFNGEDLAQQTFNLATISTNGLTQTFNLADGTNQTVTTAPSYFVFKSSNPDIATVDELGVISVLSTGSATITGNIGGTLDISTNQIEGGTNASGSLSLTSLGDFTPADTPDESPENVISIFSDAYTNVPVDYYNGFFNGDGQTTQGGVGPGGADISINGDGIINYTQLNFVGIGTFLNVQPIDATQMTHLHVDINVQEAIDSGDRITLQLLNGVQTANELSGSVVLNSSQLATSAWRSFDIPLGSFGIDARDALGLLFFNSNNNANVPTISNIYVDNIYFYKEVVEPTENVDDSAATQVALPIGFQSTSLTYDIGVFAGADSAVETNPDQSGINPTTTILRSTKTNGADFFAGTTLELDTPVDFSMSQIFRMKVWSPKANIPVRIKLENSGNPGQFIELDANTTTSNEWEELQWDFSGTNFNVGPLDRVVIFFEFIDGVLGDGSTYYCDDLKLLE